ncbi:MAG TPA: metallophosphoesterase [Acidimicrobiia bacterium]|nr:metallophosphoesterase [Acidimicrobiia bacterium]
MAPAPLSRRHMLGLLAAGLVTACTPARREHGATAAPASPLSTTTTTTTSASTTTVPPAVAPSGDAEPPFDRVHPMSGFVAFGDFGGGSAQGAVAAGMLQWVRDGHRVDALVTTGDNVYDFGEPKYFEAYLRSPYRALQTTGRPLWATLGNHDEAAGHGAQQLAFLGLPALPYKKTLPGVRFLFLDANHPDDAQARWLTEQLAAPSPPLFTVAVFHQPVFSCGLHGRTPEVISHWYQELNSGGVSLVLNGHDHEYQRFLTAEGTTFIVTGGGGRELYPLIPGCDPPEMRVGVVKNHFTGVEVYSDRMAVTAVATDGSVIDRVDIPAALPTP